MTLHTLADKIVNTEFTTNVLDPEFVTIWLPAIYIVILFLVGIGVVLHEIGEHNSNYERHKND